jgi:hypothetical protein
LFGSVIVSENRSFGCTVGRERHKLLVVAPALLANRGTEAIELFAKPLVARKHVAS